MKVDPGWARPRYCFRQFSLDHDLQDLIDICANVYNGTDYMPNIIHHLARDPGCLILAAEAPGTESSPSLDGAPPLGKSSGVPPPGDARGEAPGAADHLPEPSDRSKWQQQAGTRIDGIFCAERRGSSVFLFGLRVREEMRGSGLGHLLMEAICSQAPRVLADRPDVQQPPLAERTAAATDPVGHIASVSPLLSGPLPEAATTSAAAPLESTSTAVVPDRSQQQLSARGDSCAGGGDGTPGGSDAGRGFPQCRPITHIISVTIAENVPAQRILGRRLPGPLCMVEGWPGHGPMEEYQAAVGYVRGRGVPPDAPSIVDWLPGARAALQSDPVAMAMVPGWRRAGDAQGLRRVVERLLGAAVGESNKTGSGANGTGSGRDHSGTSNGGRCESGRIDGLAWLPMGYDVWPLDSAFVQQNLAEGNIWLLEAAPQSVSADEDQDEYGDSQNGKTREAAAAAGEAEVVGVMLLTYFHTYGRVCAGILARDNSIMHSAIALAASRHQHFFAWTFRTPPGCRAPQRQEAPREAQRETQIEATTDYSAAGGQFAVSPDSEVQEGMAQTGRRPGCAPEPPALPPGPLPALYDTPGGFRNYWVYGGAVTGLQ